VISDRTSHRSLDSRENGDGLNQNLLFFLVLYHSSTTIPERGRRDLLFKSDYRERFSNEIWQPSDLCKLEGTL
jgi:hypothetical protein